MSTRSLFNADSWQNPWQTLDQRTASLNDEPIAVDDNLQATYMAGTLGADHFTVNLADKLTVISGKGNVDYGEGKYDILDLSIIASTEVVKWFDAAVDGVVFNVGNGARVYDGLLLTQERRILFEGLDVVQFSDKNVYFSICPNDPDFSQQWNLHMMGVHNAWRFTQGTAKILVGIQDTGLGLEATSPKGHSELPETIAIAANLPDDFAGGHPPKYIHPSRLTSHGTKVQSIISAKSNNGKGMCGINWKSSIAHIDVMGADEDDMDLDEATDFLIKMARRNQQRLVVNMSLCNRTPNPAFEQLIAQNPENALFVIAVGNDNKNELAYPASLGKDYKNVIAVGAAWGRRNRWVATQPGTRIDYSEGNGSNYGYGISMLGPAEVMAASATLTSHGIQFEFDPMFKGTSAATPNVAGVASLVWSLCPELSAEQVHYILAETAYRTGKGDYTLKTGHGFVCADSAVRRAIAIKRFLAKGTSHASKSIYPQATPLKPTVPVCKLAS